MGVNAPVLRGVIPPVCTPRTPGGEVDVESLARQTARLLAAGVDGVFVCGSSGEAALLEPAARLAALDAVVATVGGSVPVLHGCLDSGARQVVASARAAFDHGADAVVVTVPYYVAPSRDEVLAHFEHVAAHAGGPVVAYSIPPATHVPMPAPVAVALARAGTVVGLKDSSGDLAALREVVDGTADLGFPVLTGSETIVDAAIASGAAGVVPGLSNVDPAGYVELVATVAAGDAAAAAEYQRRLARLFGLTRAAAPGRLGVTAVTIGGYKSALHHLGVFDSPLCFPPLGALSEADHVAVAALVDAYGPRRAAGGAGGGTVSPG